MMIAILSGIIAFVIIIVLFIVSNIFHSPEMEPKIRFKR